MNSDNLTTWSRLAAWMVLSAIVLLTYVPPAFRVVTGAPHAAEHFAIFFLAGAFFALGYRRSLVALAILAVVLTGFLELFQLFDPGRHARLSDFVVNAVGACLGIAMTWLFWRMKQPAHGVGS